MILCMILMTACVDKGSVNKELNLNSDRVTYEDTTKKNELSSLEVKDTRKFTRNNIFTIFLSFSIGALSGSAITAFIFKKRLSKL